MPSILIIEDEPPVCRALRSMLERAGYTVLDAPDGRKGLALWRQQPTDVVVTDIFMPEQDGVEVLIEMRGLAERPKLIVMSGGGQLGFVDLNPVALLLGADRVLVKPFDQATFLQAVEEVLHVSV